MRYLICLPLASIAMLVTIVCAILLLVAEGSLALGGLLDTECVRMRNDIRMVRELLWKS